MVTRRRVLASGALFLGGCLSDSPSMNDSCADLRSRETASENRLTDLEVANRHSEHVQVELVVRDPEGRRCDRFDLDPDGVEEYPRIFEGGTRYTVQIESDGHGLTGEHTWDRSRYDNLLMIAEITLEGVMFEEFEH